MTMTIGQRVKYAREARDMKQHELARKVGIRQPTLSALESGKAAATKHIIPIARALRVRAEWLQYGTGAMEASPDRTEKEERLRQAASVVGDDALDHIIALVEQMAGKVNT
jgi:transcriptional regulator with XRE-family HTH domain